MLNINVLHQTEVFEETGFESSLNRIESEAFEFFNFACSRTKFKLPIVVGMDANLTLPQNISGFTAASSLRPLRSHTHSKQQAVLSWMARFEVRMLNTQSPITNSESL